MCNVGAHNTGIRTSLGTPQLPAARHVSFRHSSYPPLSEVQTHPTLMYSMPESFGDGLEHVSSPQSAPGYGTFEHA